MNKNKSYSHINNVMKQIDNNQFVSLFEDLSLLDLNLPVDLLQKLKCLFLNRNEHYLDWHKFLANLCLQNQAIKIFSTFSELGFDIKSIKQAFKVIGDGLVRINDSSFELVTISNQLAKISLENIPLHDSMAIHLWGNFKSNLEDNLYLELTGDNYVEKIRFGNRGVSHARTGTTSLLNTKIDKLYSIVLNDEFVKIYVNGILSICRSIPSDFCVKDISLKLIGTLGADLSAAVHGLEIWTSNQIINNLFSKDSDFFIQRLEEYINNSMLNNIHELLESIEGFDITIAEEHLLKLLSNELNTEQGYREWIFEKLLSRVSKESIATWYKKNIVNFPVPIIEVHDLSVEFYRTPNTRFSLSRLLSLHKNEKFKVLDNININIFPGDIIGIVGANGAGKSTLLKTISGMIPIDKGNVNLHARHLLLSAGLGARNELTGRENIYLSGCFMGLSKKQIQNLFDEIVDFSELGEAIDRPFKYYSDGMKGRLVFSIATSVSPDILMLDELLSAGDIKFQQKAAKRMDQLIQRAKVVVVVTHSSQFVVEKCNKALLLSKGKQLYYGDPSKAIALYLNELHMQPTENETDLGPNNISLMQQLNQSSGMPIGGQRVN